jgi:hypothetical protein
MFRLEVSHLHYERKGKMDDTLEKLYIYRETKNRNQIKDRLTIQSNPVFETIVKHSTPSEGSTYR